MVMDEEPSNDKQFCEFAKKNPQCPYVTVINEARIKLDRIDRILVGDDMMGGLVNMVKDLQATIKKQKAVENSWINNLKPVAYIVAGSIITLVISHIYG